MNVILSRNPSEQQSNWKFSENVFMNYILDYYSVYNLKNTCCVEP